MSNHDGNQPDFGVGEKKTGIYVSGFIGCCILTLVAFWAVMSGRFSNTLIFSIIYPAAIIQFLVQAICFLRLNTQTAAGKKNVMSFVFTGVILVTIILGSLWIMWTLNYNMMS